MFEFRLHSIPETREEFKPGELPICQRDIRQLAQVDEELAERARFVTQLIRLQGGVSPNTISYVFPDEKGVKGDLDEEALGRVIINLTIWNDIK